VKKRNITSVLIILTANDSVADSRQAFKEGAWDYISKNIPGHVFEELDESIQEAISYFNRWGGKEDEAWIKENMTPLLHRYRGQYIAVINNSVIEAAKTEEELEERLRERKLPIFLSTIKKIEAPSKPSIADLIQQGENATLEFKSSLQWDVKQNKVNKNLRFAVLKTMAAFLNSEGGTLLIGVADDGAILGLSGDLFFVKDKMLDEFENFLRKLINSRISAAFSRLIKIRFEKIEGKDICVVEVTRATKPVFMRDQRTMKFYIRDSSSSSTRALNSSERHLYIRTHWK
jgi:CheY-like chemotaxis protein